MRVGFAIIVGLAASAALIVVLVAAGAPVWAGLVLLAVLDVAIIGWGYAAVRRMGDSLARRGRGLCDQSGIPQMGYHCLMSWLVGSVRRIACSTRSSS